MTMTPETFNRRFLVDVNSHKVVIHQDDGLYRRILFKHPDLYRGCYWFELVTWPGTLCINGDMGTYTFRRNRDMFKFFRDEEVRRPGGLSLGVKVNPGYWVEKLTSTDPGCGHKQFSAEAFCGRVKDHYAEWVGDNGWDDSQAERGWEKIRASLINVADMVSNEFEAYDLYREVQEFEFEGFEFIDFFDAGSPEEYTYHFLWCLHAIVWGIGMYDTMKAEMDQARELAEDAENTHDNND